MENYGMLDFFSKRLREERKRLGFIQDVMAKKGGVSKASYCAYEAGTTKPSIDFLIALATSGVDTQYLLTGVHTVISAHAEDLQDYPEIGTALVFEVLLFVEKWLVENDASMPPDKKIGMIKTLCRFLADDDRKRAHEKTVCYNNIAVRMKKIDGFLKAASS